METREEKIGAVTVLSVNGKLDATTSSELEVKLITFIDAGEKRLVLDFTELSYISSSGLRVLLIGAKHLNDKGGGKMVVTGLQPNVREIFEISGFQNIFTIFSSRQEAVTDAEQV